MRLKAASMGILFVLISMTAMIVPSTADTVRGDNLAGDMDTFPEYEELLNLSDGEYATGKFFSNNTLVFVSASDPNNYPVNNLFSGTHEGVKLSPYQITLNFPYTMKITRIRVYPMDEDSNKCNEIHVSLFGLGYNSATPFHLSILDASGITDKSEYFEMPFDNLISSNIAFSTNGPYLNEIEIYYDKYFNPYHYTSEAYYNYTNITNEYTNETYVTHRNDTYVNNTYLNTTYENITYQNETYVNNTNETGNIIHENVTHVHYNNTYFNETNLLDKRELEKKIDWLVEEYNRTEGSDLKESKSLADKTYTDPILIILLLAILVFQVFLFLQRKRMKEQSLTNEEKAIEPEVEHTPTRGFTKEGEVDIISRKVQQERIAQQQQQQQPPPAQYSQYQHKQVQSPVQTPPPEVNAALPPETPPQTPPESYEQKALPEHKLTP